MKPLRKKFNWRVVGWGVLLGVVGIFLFPFYAKELKIGFGIVNVAIPVIFFGALAWNKFQVKRRNDRQRYWRQKIKNLADDLRTDSDGLSFDDVITMLDSEQQEDIYLELQKMRAGKRVLQKAIKITGQEGYKREA